MVRSLTAGLENPVKSNKGLKMKSNENSWLQNRIAAAVADDFYLDRAEEKSIKEEAASRGLAVDDTEFMLRSVLDEYGAVSERQLLDELDKWLHQSTDDDKKLDAKEERDTLDQVLRPAQGKKKGLDPVKAEEYVASFCKVNGVKRTSDTPKTKWIIGILLFASIAGGASYFLWATRDNYSGINDIAPSNSTSLSSQDKLDIDDQLRRAKAYVEAAQFTDPPEKSAKACIDEIRRIDPSGSYKNDEMKELISAIVSEYLKLADRAMTLNDTTGAKKWLDRASLFNADSELILDKQRELGLL